MRLPITRQRFGAEIPFMGWVAWLGFTLMFPLVAQASETAKLMDICDYTQKIIFTAASMRADEHALSDVIARLDKNHQIRGKSTFAMQLRLTTMVYSEAFAKIQNPDDYAKRAYARCIRAITDKK